MLRRLLPAALRHPSHGVLRQFGTALTLLVAAGGFRQRLDPPTSAALFTLALGIALVTAFAPRVLRGVFVVVSALTFPIGLVLQRRLLGAFYFGIFTPLAWLLRAYRRLRRSGGEPPGWVEIDGSRRTEDYFRPY